MLKRNIFIFILLSIALDGNSQDFKSTIIRVIDGDTYVFQTQEGSFKVRMYGTDAPERDQPYSKESADFLNQYLHKEAILKARGVDRYSRTLGVLYIGEKDINLLSIKEGNAWHYKRYSSEKDYAVAEEFARKNKLGLWSLPNSIPPWSWRKK